jgi:fructokinase
MNQPTILCAGETLWDVLPAGEFIGGAPFNVASHCARLGARALLVSRLGKDERGRRALECAKGNGMDLSLLQIDARLPTGAARAVLAADGSAHYEFLSPAAWDALTATPAALAAAAAADAMVYGTLGQRDPRSREAIGQLARAARWRVFDPNLRTPHVDRALCEAGLRAAGLVKLNEEECALFAGWFGGAATPEALWQTLAQRFGVQSLCVTLGAAGARLHWQGQWHAQDAVPVAVADTVGAGDAFLAMLVCELLGGRDASAALAHAAQLAAFVASQAGAVPAYEAARFRSSPAHARK